MQPLARSFLIASALLLVATTSARAQPGATSPHRIDAGTVEADGELDDGRPVASAVEAATAFETEVVEERYGLQTLAVDGTAVALLLAGASAGSEGLIYGALLTGLVGPAAVHAAHHNPGRAALSVGLRLALPAAGASLAARPATCGDEEWFCGLGEALVGMSLGYLAAATIDAAMATETKTVKRERVAWTPTVTPRGDGFQVGVAATF